MERSGALSNNKQTEAGQWTSPSMKGPCDAMKVPTSLKKEQRMSFTDCDAGLERVRIKGASQRSTLCEGNKCPILHIHWLRNQEEGMEATDTKGQTIY